MYDSERGIPLHKLADLGDVADLPIIYDKKVRVANGGEWVLRHISDHALLLAVAVYDGDQLRIYQGYGDSVAYQPVTDDE